MIRVFCLVLPLIVAAAGCSKTAPSQPTGAVEIVSGFETGPDGWESGFSDYSIGQENEMELQAEYRQLPSSLGLNRSGLFISGINRSDDLFMFVRRRVNGLPRSTVFDVSLVVEFATDAPHGCAGVGGSPGESVYLKAGASEIEPLATPGPLERVVLNIDKGNQSQGGRAAVVLGTIENTLPCEQGPDGAPIRGWELKTLRSTEAVRVQSDSSGTVWLLVGTDSGFEGRTDLFYTRIAATFTPR